MADRKLRVTSTRATRGPAASASVRISVAQGLIEISGTEKFVAAQLSDTAAIQFLWSLVEKSQVAADKLQLEEMKRRLAEQLADQAKEEAEARSDSAKDLIKAMLAAITEYQERQNEATSKTLLG